MRKRGPGRSPVQSDGHLMNAKRKAAIPIGMAAFSWYQNARPMSVRKCIPVKEMRLAAA